MDCLDTEDGRNMLFRIVGYFLIINRASYPIRLNSSNETLHILCNLFGVRISDRIGDKYFPYSANYEK